MKFIEFPELPSTSTYVADHAASLESDTLVHTPSQTAGRGQRGNCWESEPGMNLTFTAIMRPDSWPARRQFLISEAVAVAIAETLCRLSGVKCLVKWPNDIYALDPASGRVGKICGILISHSLEGSMIRHTIIGAGVNINQMRFLSDAPNPVSLKNITSKDHDLSLLLRELAAAIELSVKRLWSDPEFETQLHDRYMRLLWRGDGKIHTWTDMATGTRFEASIYAIEPLGHMVLRTADSELRRYAFKEVAF